MDNAHGATGRVLHPVGGIITKPVGSLAVCRTGSHKEYSVSERTERLSHLTSLPRMI
jgi:hypothetical protein